MKQLLLLAFLSLPASLHAQAVTNVHEVATSSVSVVRSIYVCATPIDVVAATSTGTINGSFAVEVYNIAASTLTVNCGFDASVSAASTSANYGREVAAGSGVYWGVAVPARKVWCVGSTGCTRVTITQLK